MTEVRKKILNSEKIKFGSFSLEAYKAGGKIKILICGVIGINDFSTEQIYLTTQGGRITILGNNLSLIILENKCVEIHGEVRNVCF